MTKRISQPNADVVSTAKMAAIVADVAAPAAVAVPEASAVVAGEPAPLAMVGAGVAPVVQDSAVTTTTQESVSTTTPDPMTGEAETTTTTTATQNTVYDDGDAVDSDATDYTPFIVGGVLLAGGIIALAVSGGDDEDDDGGNTPAPTPTPTPTPTNSAPVFTSGATATVAENAGNDAVVYTAVATDADSDTVTYSLSGTDAALFGINAATGEITLASGANFEDDAEYSFTVTAGDGTTLTTQDVVVTVTDVNEAPAFATATAAVSVDENIDVGTVVYDADTVDPDADAVISYSLTGEDADAFVIDEATGEVTFVASPDFETQEVYNFEVVATDDGDPALTASQSVTVAINDLDDDMGTAASLDVDGVTLSAADDDFTFQDDADVLTEVNITGFEEGDTVVVTGADGLTAGTTYSFSSIDDDLIIDFSGGGASNRIIIEDVLSPSDFVSSEAEAEAAIGFDFFSYA